MTTYPTDFLTGKNRYDYWDQQSLPFLEMQDAPMFLFMAKQEPEKLL